MSPGRTRYSLSYLVKTPLSGSMILDFDRCIPMDSRPGDEVPKVDLILTQQKVFARAISRFASSKSQPPVAHTTSVLVSLAEYLATVSPCLTYLLDRLLKV